MGQLPWVPAAPALSTRALCAKSSWDQHPFCFVLSCSLHLACATSTDPSQQMDMLPTWGGTWQPGTAHQWEILPGGSAAAPASAPVQGRVLCWGTA